MLAQEMTAGWIREVELVSQLYPSRARDLINPLSPSHILAGVGNGVTIP